MHVHMGHVSDESMTDWMEVAYSFENCDNKVSYAVMHEGFSVWRAYVADPKHRYVDQAPDSFWIFSSVRVRR